MENTVNAPAVKIFNGTYTLESLISGEHRTFRIRTESWMETGKRLRVLSLLTGPQNTEDYTGFAFVSENGVHVWKSKLDGQYEVYAEQLWSLALDAAFSPWAEKYRFLMEGRCAVCNRPLTTPESIRMGIGPICAEEGL